MASRMSNDEQRFRLKTAEQRNGELRNIRYALSLAKKNIESTGDLIDELIGASGIDGHRRYIAARKRFETALSRLYDVAQTAIDEKIDANNEDANSARAYER